MFAIAGVNYRFTPADLLKRSSGYDDCPRSISSLHLPSLLPQAGVRAGVFSAPTMGTKSSCPFCIVLL